MIEYPTINPEIVSPIQTTLIYCSSVSCPNSLFNFGIRIFGIDSLEPEILDGSGDIIPVHLC